MEDIADSRDQLPRADQAPSAPAPADKGRAVAHCLLLLLSLAPLYGLLYSTHWRPANDSEVFLTIARNINLGQGYTFNNLPVEKIPPGWPLVLAGLLRISTSFAFLSLAPMLCMLGAAPLWYLVMRRITTPGRALVTVLISAIVFGWYQMGITFLSDSPFCLIGPAAILVAMQIQEGKSGAWRIILLAVLCVAMLLMRWTAPITWLLVAGALVRGQFRPRWNRQMLALSVSAIVTCGGFFLLRHDLGSRKEQFLLNNGISAASLSKTEWLLASDYAVKNSDKGNVYVNRFVNSGKWLAGLFWRPCEVAIASPTAGRAVNALGWGMLALMLAWGLQRVRQGEWIWLALALGCGGLILQRTRPVPRYFVPMLPLLLLAAWCGIEQLGRVRSAAFIRRAARPLSLAFLAAVALCNLGLMGVDAWAARADDFYDRYEAGEHKELIAICHWLREQGVGDGKVAVDDVMDNLGKSRPNAYTYRATAFLTGRVVRSVPRRKSDEDPAVHRARVLEWARANKIQYWIHRPPSNPWRIWHFRAPWLQERQTHKPVGPATPSFELYRITPAGGERIEVPDVRDWPMSVPPPAPASPPAPKSTSAPAPAGDR